MGKYPKYLLPVGIAAAVGLAFWIGGIGGHWATLLGIAIAAFAGWHEAGRPLRNLWLVGGAVLGGIGAVVSGIQTDQLQQKLYRAVVGGEEAPFLEFIHKGGDGGEVRTVYEGKYPVFEVQFEIGHLDEKIKLLKAGKSLEDVANKATKLLPPLNSFNLIPGFNKIFPAFRFPTDSNRATYQIIIHTRNSLFIEYCRLFRKSKKDTFTSGCFVIDPSGERRLLQMFYDERFPKGRDGKYDWPTADSVNPPMPELESFEKIVVRKIG